MADGVSSCKNSYVGAQIACKISADIILDHVNYYFDSAIEKVKAILLVNIKYEIKERAKKDGCEPEDYASTLSFICYNKLTNQMMAFSLGDSRIYHADNNSIVQVNKTKDYEHNLVCSTVSFLAEKEAALYRYDLASNDKFLLCTDGMWKTAEKNQLFDLPEILDDGDKLVELLNQYQINDDCSFLLAA